MRRFFLFCVLVICFLCAGFLKGQPFCVANSIWQKTSYVVGYNHSNLDVKQLDVKNFDLSEMTAINSQNAQLVGETENFNLNHFKKELNLKIISCEEVCGRIVITGFSDKLRKFVYVNGERVNVQISIESSLIKVGSPLILGAF